MRTHPHFVADNTMGSRRETAVLLVGTAREFGLHQRSIRATHGGFWVTQEMADVLYDESVQVTDESDEPTEVSGNDSDDAVVDETEVKRKAKSTKKTSGNRAAKNTEPTEE